MKAICCENHVVFVETELERLRDELVNHNIQMVDLKRLIQLLADAEIKRQEGHV